MPENLAKSAKEIKEASARPAVSAVLADGSLVETVFQPAENRTLFCIANEREIRFERDVVVNGHRLVPYSPNNNLLRNNVVLFSSEPEEYGSEAELVGEVQAFIRRYVDVSPLFEKVASYYVLLSWVHDAFNELPYLRLRGDPGSGKTRFLLTAGSLCYKPIFASGASTVSPIFRILDAFRGTLIIDEGDFRLSDERAEIVKILNNGNAKGFPVLRSEVSPSTKEFNPTAYAVFGPKLVATRGYFQDRALESRCITEEMGLARMRDDIPINLPSASKDAARRLRNKLLLFRFRNLHRLAPGEDLVDRTIEPRLNQIFVPILSVIKDPGIREELRAFARGSNRDLITDRGFDMEAQVLEVIRDLLASGEGKLAVKDIASLFADRHQDDYERKVTPKWIGTVIRRRLRIATQRLHGVFVVPPSEGAKIRTLLEKYGVEQTAGPGTREEDHPDMAPQGDVG